VVVVPDVAVLVCVVISPAPVVGTVVTCTLAVDVSVVVVEVVVLAVVATHRAV